ncbi:MAG: hypothetical protein WBV94_25160 [Blastocatellia bacterium]
MPIVEIQAKVNKTEIDRIVEAVKEKVRKDPRALEELVQLFPTALDMFSVEVGNGPDGAPFVQIFPAEKLLEFVGLKEN